MRPIEFSRRLHDGDSKHTHPILRREVSLYHQQNSTGRKAGEGKGVTDMECGLIIWVTEPLQMCDRCERRRDRLQSPL